MTTDPVHGISFPVEIWRMVIVLAVKTSEPMDNYHDASKPIAARFHLARRVTSKSPEYTLMLLCKSFNHIATEFFYEKVSIHSKRRLEALSKGLKVRKVANNLAKWTRRLDVKYACRETDHNDCDVGSINQLAPILRWCPNLTHLIIDVVNFPSEYGDKDAGLIVLEVLHWDFDLITHEPVTVPMGTLSLLSGT
ncbi:hypothetical protein BD410DRAFT_382743 [Rickenella mellea]|uniref:Uncharacterized protein n=1 Tax=Rickenella mellea TaxID=50990 RepID=A0A4Y7PYP2_9AGAM|nr:hypothetical protein BD410DRAFT_382743 [Rickenella mellea]